MRDAAQVRLMQVGAPARGVERRHVLARDLAGDARGLLVDLGEPARVVGEAGKEERGRGLRRARLDEPG